MTRLRLAKARLAFVAKWSSRAKALEKQEAELHASLPKHIKHILKGKRLLLLQEMIDFYGLPDTDLVRHMKEGFSLSGWMPSSGSFPASTKRPEFSVDALKLLSAGFNAATLSKAKCDRSVLWRKPLGRKLWLRRNRAGCGAARTKLWRGKSWRGDLGSSRMGRFG